MHNDPPLTIPFLKSKSLAMSGDSIAVSGQTRVTANTHLEIWPNDSIGWVIAGPTESNE